MQCWIPHRGSTVSCSIYWSNLRLIRHALSCYMFTEWYVQKVAGIHHLGRLILCCLDNGKWSKTMWLLSSILLAVYFVVLFGGREKKWLWLLHRATVPGQCWLCSKRIVLVPKCYVLIDSNFLNWITNGCSPETCHSRKTCFKPYNIPNDRCAWCLCEIFAINFAKRRRNSPWLEMLKNVTSSDVVMETRDSKIGNY